MDQSTWTKAHGMTPSESRNATLPPIVERYYETLQPLISLTPIAKTLLESFMTADLKSEKIGEIIRTNPYYEQIFLRTVESLQMKEPPSVEASVVLLGMEGSRNLILAVQMQRLVLGIHPEFKADGKIGFAPKEFLKRALLVQDLRQAVKDGFPDLAFAAGLVFDLLELVLSKKAADPKKAAAYSDRIFKLSLRAAQIAAEVSKHVKGFNLKKYSFSSTLVRDIGKLGLLVLDPDYLEFAELCEKLKIPRGARILLERRRFGTSHEVIGSLIASEFGVLGETSLSVLFQNEPFLLHDLHPHAYLLSGMTCLSSQIAENFKKSDNPEDPEVKKWKAPELGAFPIDLSDVLKSLKDF